MIAKQTKRCQQEKWQDDADQYTVITPGAVLIAALDIAAMQDDDIDRRRHRRTNEDNARQCAAERKRKNVKCDHDWQDSIRRIQNSFCAQQNPRLKSAPLTYRKSHVKAGAAENTRRQGPLYLKKHNIWRLRHLGATTDREQTAAQENVEQLIDHGLEKESAYKCNQKDQTKRADNQYQKRLVEDSMQKAKILDAMARDYEQQGMYLQAYNKYKEEILQYCQAKEKMQGGEKERQVDISIRNARAQLTNCLNLQGDAFMCQGDQLAQDGNSGSAAKCYKDAVEKFQQVIRLYDAHSFLADTTQIQKIQAKLHYVRDRTQHSTKHLEDKGNALLTQGDQLLLEGSLSDAIKLYTEAVQVYEQVLPIYCHLQDSVSTSRVELSYKGAVARHKAAIFEQQDKVGKTKQQLDRYYAVPQRTYTPEFMQKITQLIRLIITL